MDQNEAKYLIQEYVKGLLAQGRNREASAFAVECALLCEINEKSVHCVMKRFDQGLAL